MIGWVLAVQSVALFVLACSISLLVRKVQSLSDADVNHAHCIAHVAHYVGDSFAAQVLRVAAEDLDSTEGQTELRRIANSEYRLGGASVASLWLTERADSLVFEDGEAA